MSFRMRVAGLLVLAIGAVTAAAGVFGGGSAQSAASNRVVVHVAGPQAGTVDIDVWYTLLPDLLYDEDTGELILPTNYCGLRIKLVGALHWDDGFGNLIEAENHGEVTVVGNSYQFMGEDVTNYYLGGMTFTGALDTCEDNQPWYFPTPLSYGGNGPQYGAQRLILELDMPQNSLPTIEFLDHAFEPMELPDLYADWEPLPHWNEYCEKVPEFCEEDDDVIIDIDNFVLPCIPFTFGCGGAPPEFEPGLKTRTPNGTAPISPDSLKLAGDASGGAFGPEYVCWDESSCRMIATR